MLGLEIAHLVKSEAQKFLLPLALGLAGACSSDEFSAETGSGGSAGSGANGQPADLSGSYLVTITNGTNDCSFVMDWMEGAVSTNNELVIEQSGSELTAHAQGLAGLALFAVTGTAMFEGSVTGSDFVLTAYGTKAYAEGNCMYTLNAFVTGTLTGDAVAGTIDYRPAISDNPDCQSVECEAHQAFSGTRPPSN
jgi:hypothetical protein